MPSSRRLAMLEAGASHQTPPTRVNGLEEAVEVKGLGGKDTVAIVVELRGGGYITFVLSEGRTDLSPDPDWKSYYFRKHSGENTKPTTIEVILRA